LLLLLFNDLCHHLLVIAKDAHTPLALRLGLLYVQTHGPCTEWLVTG
jgi:hypothetical protein